jgi:hypothetical protein
MAGIAQLFMYSSFVHELNPIGEYLSIKYNPFTQ